MSSSRHAFSLVEILIVITILAIILAISIPSMVSTKLSANEAGAVAGLKAIGTSQVVFRDKDVEKDGNFDYGTLQELRDTQMIDKILGTGTKQGYYFQTAPSTISSQLYYAVASPILPEQSGNRYFALNQEGVIKWRTGTPFPLNVTDCLIPADGKAIGD